MTTTPAPTDLDTAVDVAARAIQAYQARTAFPPEQYTWDAIPQEWRDRHLAAARVMVEAAMTPLLDELAKTRIDRDEWREGHARALRNREQIEADLDFDPACSCRRCGKCDQALGELTAAREELAKTRAELDALRVQYAGVQLERDLANEQLRGWRKRAANPEANPATTAEPADEPKATDITWPECDRGVLGDWCRRPVNHEGDCSPKSRRLAPPNEPAAS